MLLSSSGLVGALCYGFIYLYPVAMALLTSPPRRLVTVLALAHLSILVAAVGNPYVWSGGMGLLFVTLVMAVMESAPIRRAASARGAPE